MPAQTTDPIYVTVAPDGPPAETPGTTVGDVVFGSLGIAGVLLVVSLVLGGLTALLLVRWHKLHPPERNHPPSVSPFVPGPAQRDSSQAR